MNKIKRAIVAHRSKLIDYSGDLQRIAHELSEKHPLELEEYHFEIEKISTGIIESLREIREALGISDWIELQRSFLKVNNDES